MALAEDDYLKAQETLTLPPEAPSIEALDKGVKQAVDSARPWISGRQVVGTGVAPKRKDGQVLPKQLALVVYVTRKRVLESLPRKQVIPTEVAFPGLPEPIVTDVVAIGKLRLEMFDTRIRPLLPAYSGGLLVSCERK